MPRASIERSAAVAYTYDYQGKSKIFHYPLTLNRPALKLVSNIEFITVHGLNEGHIAPYTDIEFQLTKYQTYIIMKS